jgi:Sec-independent protein translocase protein TatA
MMDRTTTESRMMKSRGNAAKAGRGYRLHVLGLLALGAVTLGPVFGLGITEASAAEKQDTEIASVVLDELGGSGGNIAVIEPAELSNVELIEDQRFFGRTYIEVVDYSSLKGYEPQALSDFILREKMNEKEHGLNLLVVNGLSDSKIYVSAGNPELKAAVISALEGESSPDGVIASKDPGWDILQNSDEIQDAQSKYVTYPNGFLIAGVIFGVVVLVFAPLWVPALLDGLETANRNRRYNRGTVKRKKSYAKEERSKKRQARAEAARQAKELREREAKAAPITPRLETSISTLQDANKSIKVNDPKLSEAITQVLERFTELRSSISLMEADKVKREILYLEYADRLEQLVTIIGPKYYQDIKQNPEHWRNPEWKLESICQAFDSTAAQILESIIQLKEGAEFEFESSIDRVLGFKVTSAKDMLNG